MFAVIWLLVLCLLAYIAFSFADHTRPQCAQCGEVWTDEEPIDKDGFRAYHSHFCGRLTIPVACERCGEWMNPNRTSYRLPQAYVVYKPESGGDTLYFHHACFGDYMRGR